MRHASNGIDNVWNFLGMQSSWTDFMNLLGATIVNDPLLLNEMLDDSSGFGLNQYPKGLNNI